MEITSMIILFSLFSFVLPSSCGIRGVKEADCPLYAAETILCDSKTVHKKYVNDDYCDCPLTGADEPGTAACSTGTFFCENRGYRPLSIFSSRVDDGICDCCDGSDEPAGVCSNTCKEKAYGEQKDMIAAIDEYNVGLAAKKAFIGTPILDGKKAKITENERKIQEEKAKLEVMREERKVLEEEERIRQEEEEKQRLLEEERRKLEEEQNAENEPDTPEGGEAVPEEGAEASGDSDTQSVEPSPPTGQDDAPAQSEQTQQSDEENKEEENFPYPEEYRPPPKEGEEEPQKEENFPYPEEYRPKKEGEEELQVEDEEEEDEEEDHFEEFDSEHYDEDHWHDEVDDLPSEKVKSETATSFFSFFDWLIDPLKNLYNSFFNKEGNSKSSITSDALRSKDNDIRAVERTIRDLEKENEDLTNFLAMDFGESAAFAALADQCFSVNVDKYTYEMCLFDKAAQKEGSRSTSLGKFKSLEHFEEHTVIKFEGGQSCWKGPQRSLTVNVKCGSENKVLSATEPSMCAYEMDFRSPTACTEAALSKLTSAFTDMYKDEL